MESQKSYLKNRIEPILDYEETVRTRQNLDKEIFPHTWEKSERGKIECTKGETDVSVEYSTPTFLKNITLAKQHGVTFLFSKFIELTALKIKNKGSVLDVTEILPKGYKILFSPTAFQGKDRNGSGMDPYQKVIVIEGDILNAAGLLTLLHEVGHEEVRSHRILENPEYGGDLFYSRFLSTEYPFSKGTKELGDEGLVTVLRDERDAWSSALKNIRPFMKDLEIDLQDTEKLIHGSCLQSYTGLIDKIVTRWESESTKKSS